MMITLDFNLNPIDLMTSTNASTSVNRLETSAILNSPLIYVLDVARRKVAGEHYLGRRILHTSLTHAGQLVLIKLRAQIATSTTAPSPSEGSASSGSKPGRGILSQMSAWVTYFLSDTRSNESTFIPCGISIRARAASPHPRSAMSVFWGYCNNS